MSIHINKRYSFGLIIILVSIGCGYQLPNEVNKEYSSLPDDISYNIHVKPILTDKCYTCHGPDPESGKAGLRLDNERAAYASLNGSNKRSIVPGNIAQSELVNRILHHDPELQMPEVGSNLNLSNREKAILVKWIEGGAQFEEHWSFIPLTKVDLPKVTKSPTVRNPIDHFIQARLKEEGLSPQKEADKETLIRRVSFDLTGLPPSVEEIEEFINDESPGAYEKVVDRLLNSPHYGEKMAIDWMDLARYADTHGYQADWYRDMSPWRDWVIKSFNENMPYDRFLTWQLAGDLLPDASDEQILATGFNRLHQQNLEGGIIDEEFRVAYVADRTDVLGKGLLGLTLSCAKCHDHKYDPISQKEYYQLYSFFNNVNESGQISWEGSMPTPNMLIPTKEQEEILQFIENKLVLAEESMEQAENDMVPSFQTWLERGDYKTLQISRPAPSPQAHYHFDEGNLRNRVVPGQSGKMDRQFSDNEKPTFVQGASGRGLLLDGDAWLDMTPQGIFQRSDAFSISIKVNIPSGIDKGVIFHKGIGARLYNFRGYQLDVAGDKLQVMFAHMWPDNTFIKTSVDDFPRDDWIHLVLTYDGSSKAEGTTLYMNGHEMQTQTKNDNLYKDIIFNTKNRTIPGIVEPGLQVGARWRGKGIGGASVDDIMIFSQELTPLEVIQLSSLDDMSQLLKRSPSQLSKRDKEILKDHYLARLSPSLTEGKEALRKVRQQHVEEIEDVQEVMVMKEMDEPRQSYILNRGLYDDYGEQVFPAVPDVLNIMPEEAPPNRLGLVQWLTDPSNPLTSRVAVNRYWQMFFGRGIVETTEDFGNQGSRPSHPLLLDWLAQQFMDSGWNVKALQKLMVTSATYRQSSISSEDLDTKDPENILLARGPSGRLPSEMIRDNALAASGLINLKIGGESVKPYQPDGLWNISGNRYDQDAGDDLYRRSLYTLWKRSIPNPTLNTFDQPDRSECTVRRQNTETPLQALVLMNDPTFVEAARRIGAEVAASTNPSKIIKDSFMHLTGRAPKTEELRLLNELLDKETTRFREHPDKLEGWTKTGEFEHSEKLDQAKVAAGAIVVSVIINSDASTYKR